MKKSILLFVIFSISFIPLGLAQPEQREARNDRFQNLLLRLIFQRVGWLLVMLMLRGWIPRVWVTPVVGWDQPPIRHESVGLELSRFGGCLDS